MMWQGFIFFPPIIFMREWMLIKILLYIFQGTQSKELEEARSTLESLTNILMLLENNCSFLCDKIQTKDQNFDYLVILVVAYFFFSNCDKKHYLNLSMFHCI